jgi:hypothetical protein
MIPLFNVSKLYVLLTNYLVAILVIRSTVRYQSAFIQVNLFYLIIAQKFKNNGTKSCVCVCVRETERESLVFCTICGFKHPLER